MSIIDTYVHSDNTEYEIADSATRTRVSAVEGKIPSGASSSNKMATASDITTVTNGVKANTKLIKDTVGFSGKNKLPNTAIDIAGNGITFTVNSDGTVTANGTATQNAYITLCENEPIPKGDYIITGGNALKDKFSDYGIFLTINGTSYGTRSDVENIHLEQDSIITICRAFVNANKQANNIKIEPMIRDVNILDDTYEPYFGSTAFPRSEQAVLGAKNWFNYTKETSTSNGVTFTHNADDSCTLSGQSTADQAAIEMGKFVVEKNIELVLNGASASNDAKIHLYVWDATTNSRPYTDSSKSTLQNSNCFGTGNNAEIPFYAEVGHTYGVYCRVQTTGTSVPNGTIFYPMLRLASDTDDTYAPYAMTNRELTDEIPTVIDIKEDSTSSVATINSLFISKVGKIAYVSGVLTLTSNVAAGGELLVLPPKYAIYQTDGNSGRYPLVGSNGATTIYHLFVQPSSGTKIFLAEGASSGASIRFGGIYLLN